MQWLPMNGWEAAGAANRAMSEPVVIMQQGGWTRHICLNRPDRANALNADVTLKLIQAVAECYVDDTKLLVLSGAGKHFCSGFDRVSSDQSSPAAMALLGTQIEVLLQLIWNGPFVTVACVQGSAVGGGADIAVACDYRLLTPDSVMFFPGYRMLGVSLGNRRLARAIGPGRAIDVILRSKKIRQDDAIEWGLAIGMNNADGFRPYIAGLEQKLGGIAKQSIAVLRSRLHGELPERPARYAPAA